MPKRDVGLSLWRDIQAADNAAVAPVEIQGRILATIAFIEARVRLHLSQARSCIPKILGALNLFNVVSLGRISSTLVHQSGCVIAGI